MPNHVTNQLTIVGDVSEIERCKEFMKGDERIIDFNKILPMPELLSHIGTGRTIIDGQSYDEWYFDRDPDNPYLTIDRVITGPEYRELQKHPERNWYDWSCVHWGTKWNAYDQEVLRESDGIFKIQFDTAWSAPMPVVEELAKLFPTLAFRLMYADEDLGYNTGEYEFVMGYKVKELLPEGGSNAAYEIALLVKDYAKDYIKLIDGQYQYVEEDEEEVA